MATTIELYPQRNNIECLSIKENAKIYADDLRRRSAETYKIRKISDVQQFLFELTGVKHSVRKLKGSMGAYTRFSPRKTNGVYYKYTQEQIKAIYEKYVNKDISGTDYSIFTSNHATVELTNCYK